MRHTPLLAPLDPATLGQWQAPGKTKPVPRPALLNEPRRTTATTGATTNYYKMIRLHYTPVLQVWRSGVVSV